MIAMSPQVTQIQLTDEERISGIPSSLNIQNALAALHRDGTCTDFPFTLMTGLVVVNNAIDTDHLDRLNAVMVPEALELFRMESTHHNFEGIFLVYLLSGTWSIDSSRIRQYFSSSTSL